MHPKQQGFTLIELMMVVAVVAVLAAVAIPNYRSHVIKSNRAAAESFMQQLRSREEQYVLDARNYTSTITLGGLNMQIPNDVNLNYTVTVVADNTASPPSFLITAVPKNPPQNDTLCGTLTLSSTGAKTSLGSTSLCW
ncbi:MAG TPA: pilus assembly protein PilE [Gammaproteobacteria bacterium]|nr:pilus assembly protein PilE [Gammaproteobacteria bacterium]